MLTIRDLHATIDGKEVLKGVNLTVEAGQIHALMGPNGAGKSTLAKVLAGHPSYSVTSGSISFKGVEMVHASPEERSHRGLFMGFQYPVEIPGVTNLQFLRSAYNAQKEALGQSKVSDEAFFKILERKAAEVDIDMKFFLRNVNEGLSGGEKKRNEILQMAILDPTLAILDETDSGLDIDALRTVAGGINKLMNEDKGLILITHYQRLLEYVKPHYIHIMVNGKIVYSGGRELAAELEKSGYTSLLAGAA